MTDPPSGPAPGSTPSGELVIDVVGRRVAQGAIDVLLWIGVAVVVVILVQLLPEDAGDGLAPLGLVALPIWHAAIFLIAPLLLDGRTPGMISQDLMVVRRDGSPATRGQHVVRWLFMLVTTWFGAFLVTLLVIAFSREHTRLGDKAAETLVVWAPGGTPVRREPTAVPGT